MNQRMLAIMAVAAMMALALAPCIALESDADGADLTVYRYTPKLTMTSDNFGAVKYIVWDFGDGTVLDGRWEYYIEKQEKGELLSDTMIAGIESYKALLAQNGNSLIVTTHTYAAKGTYTATAVAMNPLGFIPAGGQAYDGVLAQDDTGYNGGMGNEASKDITSPSDATLETDDFKAVAGSWCRVTYTVDVMGYPTITFDSQGGSAVDPIEVVNTHEYKPATKPADPVRDGYTFNGWYTDAGCTTPYDWTLKVTAPMTLYAGWTQTVENQYDHIITYKDGQTVLGTQNVRSPVNGEISVTITQKDPVKDGKMFKGWIFNSSDSTPKARYTSVSVPVSGLTLNAMWEDIAVEYTHTIHYSANGGKGSMSDTVVTDTNSGKTDVTLANNGFTFDSHTFKGWKIGNQTYQPGEKLQINGNTIVTVVAQWEVSSAPVTTITVYVDGKACVFPQGTKAADIVKPVKEGYVFDGWYTNPELTVGLADSANLTDGSYVYSKMTKESEAGSVYVKVDGKNTRFDAGKKVSDIVKPSKSGFVFEGWYSDSELKNKLDDSTVLTDGMTVYSKVVQKSDADNGNDNLWAYILIAIGIIVAVIGLFTHPVILIAGIAVAAVGVLELFDIINIL